MNYHVLKPGQMVLDSSMWPLFFRQRIAPSWAGLQGGSVLKERAESSGILEARL